MRAKLSEFDGQRFDVVVIGAGINGCAAAQELAAAGYHVALFDKGDYGAGSSARSSRLIHCGLRYLAPGGSPYNFLWHPRRFSNALRMTAKAMHARSEFVQRAPSRTRKILFGFPVWKDMPYRPWHVNLALRLVESAGPGDVPLEREVYRNDSVDKVPLFAQLRDRDRLLAVNAFAEYQFNWPERVTMDIVLDSRRMGVLCRNYTPVTGMHRHSSGEWSLTVADVTGEEGTATVTAKVVLNTAGIWIDRVNTLAGGTPKRKILGTKGAHIVIKLPEKFKDQGIITLNRKMEEPLYVVPWRQGLHYVAVTETVYEGDIDDVRADEADVQWLREEFNHLLPELAINSSEVISTWAGVRPLTYDPALPKGARSREIHDLESEGMPGVFALTAGPVTTHRSAGKELTDKVAARIAPARAPQPPDFTPSPFGEDLDSPAVLNHFDGVRLSDLRRSAKTEQVTSLVDLLARRTGLVWTQTCAREGARRAAEEVADILGWDESRTEREVDAYLEYVDRYHWRPDS